jgi:hypothetical protein
MTTVGSFRLLKQLGPTSVFFQFSGFESLAIAPPQKAFLVLFLPLEEENFQTFPKKYYSH